MILSCTCKHPFQDGEYGKGQRVHNLMGLHGDKARCTVCGNTRSTPGKVEIQKEKEAQ